MKKSHDTNHKGDFNNRMNRQTEGLSLNLNSLKDLNEIESSKQNNDDKSDIFSKTWNFSGSKNKQSSKGGNTV